MEYFWTNRFLSETWHFVTALLVLLALFHIVLVYWLKLSSKAWKRVDYIWLGAAALGMLSVATDVRISVANNWASIEHSRASVFFDVTRNVLGNPMSSYACLYGETASDSIEHEIENEFIKACQWWNVVSTHLIELDADSIPGIAKTDLPAINFSEPSLVDTPAWFLELLEQYEENRARYLRAFNMTTESTWESNIRYFGPFILCFAIALRITKVTGELKIAT